MTSLRKQRGVNLNLAEAIRRINKTGEFDKVDIQYYLENSGIALTEEFIDYVIHFLEIASGDLEKAIRAASGTIQMEEF